MIRCVCSVHIVCSGCCVWRMITRVCQRGVNDLMCLFSACSLFRVLSVADDYAGLSARSE